MSLKTILEEFFESSQADLSKKDLNDFIAAAEKDGKIAVEPEIKIAGVAEKGGEPMINIPGPKKKNIGNLPSNVGDDGIVVLDAELVKELQLLSNSLKNVDAVIENVGGDVFVSREWWHQVRQLIIDQKFDKAKTYITEFEGGLDTDYEKQEALSNALKELLKQL